MLKTTHIVTTLELDGPVAEVFLAKFNRLEETCVELKAQNQQIMKQNQQLHAEIKELKRALPKVYTIKEMCEILNISENTLGNYRNARLIRCCTVGQKIWFTQDQLDEFFHNTDTRYKGNFRKAE